MENLKELIERYNNQSIDRPIGYLALGGSSFYEINSSEPLQLNMDFYGFIINDKGEVEIYSNEYNYTTKFYENEDYEIEVCYPTKFFIKEEINKRYWGKTLNHYYLHPYFPTKEIVAFKIIRILPNSKLNQRYEVNAICVNYSGFIQLENRIYSVIECLKYPEFFKPLYK